LPLATAVSSTSMATTATATATPSTPNSEAKSSGWFSYLW
jgi:hypothetical protein